MRTSLQIGRFISNLDDDDQSQGFEVFYKLCEHYGWQGHIVGDSDIALVFNEVVQRPITETELEELHDIIDIFEVVNNVAMQYLAEVISKYIANKQEESDNAHIQR
jgi:hypothetical protein